MKKHLVSICVVALLAAVCFLGLKYNIPNLDRSTRSSIVPVDRNGPIESVLGRQMRVILDWRFTEGPFPQTWGWGEWEERDGRVWGRHEAENPISAYMMPMNCGHDFVIETRARALRALPGKRLSVQLLIRDDEWVNHESGVSFIAGSNRAVVRHMARGTEFILDFFERPETFEFDRWYKLQLSMIDGRIRAAIDDEEIELADFRYPVANQYCEPHFSLDCGEAEFEYFKVYALP